MAAEGTRGPSGLFPRVSSWSPEVESDGRRWEVLKWWSGARVAAGSNTSVCACPWDCSRSRPYRFPRFPPRRAAIPGSLQQTRLGIGGSGVSHTPHFSSFGVYFFTEGGLEVPKKWGVKKTGWGQRWQPRGGAARQGGAHQELAVGCSPWHRRAPGAALSSPWKGCAHSCSPRHTRAR